MTTAAKVCDWLVVVDRGALVYQGPVEAFVSRAAPTVAAVPEHAGDLGRLVAAVRARGLVPAPGGRELLVPADGGDPRAVAVVVNRAAIAEGVVLAELHVRRPDLEAHYLAMLEGADR